MSLLAKVLVFGILSLIIIISLVVFSIILKKIFLEKIIKESREKKNYINKKSQLQLNIMTRFENLRRQEKKFVDSYKLLNDCYRHIKFDLSKIKSKYEELRKQTKIFWSIKFFKTYKEFCLMHEKLLERFNEFDNLSSKLSEEWVVFEDIWSYLLEAIYKLNSYYEANIKLIPNFSKIIKEKTKEYSLELTNIRDTKGNMSFSLLNEKLNTLQIKIKDLTLLLDSAINFEWAIFNHIEKLLNKNRGSLENQIIKKLIDDLKANIALSNFKNIDSSILKIYKIIREQKVTELYTKQIIKFINENFEVFSKNQKWIVNFYNQNIELLSKNEFTNNQFKKINKLYNELKKSTLSISYKIFGSFINYTYLCSGFLNEAQNLIDEQKEIERAKNNFLKTYEETKNIYFEVVLHDMLPKDQNVFDLQNKLNIGYNQYTKIANKLNKKNNTLTVSSLNLIVDEWNKNLSMLINRISENSAYKQMYDFLVEKIVNLKVTKLNENDGLKVKQLLFECKLEIDNNNYKNAFLKIKKYMKNRGKNVQQNFN